MSSSGTKIPSCVSFDSLPDVLTLQQAAQILQVSDNTMRKLAIEGAIPAIKVGQQWRIPLARLKEYLNE